MNFNRVLTLARRVMRQISRDRRTMGLFMIVPLGVLALAAILLRSEMGAIPLGVINQDEGVNIVLLGEMSLADRIIEALGETESLEVVELVPEAADGALREGRVRGVVTFPPDFSSTFSETREATIPLRLEGANPTHAIALQGNLLRASMNALASMASLTGGPALDADELPVTFETDYLYGGEQYDLFDFFAPALLALWVLFFVFLLTTVSFLRERSQGTMERLMATPASRLEIVSGYMLGFMVFALAQAILLLLFTVFVLQIHYAGSMLIVFLIEALLVVGAVNLGIFLSTFARNEFQVVQFIPLVIFPMVLLSGLFWPVEDLPSALQPFAYLMPLTYANQAMRDVMIKGWGLAEVWPQLAALVIFGATMLFLAATTIQREAA